MVKRVYVWGWKGEQTQWYPTFKSGGDKFPLPLCHLWNSMHEAVFFSRKVNKCSKAKQFLQFCNIQWRLLTLTVNVPGRVCTMYAGRKWTVDMNKVFGGQPNQSWESHKHLKWVSKVMFSIHWCLVSVASIVEKSFTNAQVQSQATYNEI